MRDAADLGGALKDEEDFIEIEGDLVSKVFRIRATGRIAWLIAIGAVGVAVGVAIAAPPAMGLAAPPVALAFGTATAAAYGIAKAGGAKALSRVRSYKVVEQEAGLLVLMRPEA